ncbi:hypothetical protein MNAN1_003284 [Malassezia nana]|uniref:Uncharacterized protein n=1 Tax=Malassezia nana TaxID=180528 RepID=A0AAF0ESZ1_9BASI|nr:hypothetical protein MNAN1_003284 [Malassezia nana]
MLKFLELRYGDKCQTTLVPNSRNSNSSTLDFDLASQLEDINKRDSSGKGHNSMSDSFTTQRFSEGHSVVNASVSTHRIKLMRQGKHPKMIAVSMPTNFSRQSLMLKAQEKLGHSIQTLHTQETPGGPQLYTDEELQTWLNDCLAQGKKLLLFVGPTC